MLARTLRRRVQRGRMNFYRAKRRHGFCQYCQAWGRVESVELNKIFQHLRGRLEALLPSFWVDFDNIVLTKPQWSQANIWVRAIYRFLVLHHETGPAPVMAEFGLKGPYNMSMGPSLSY